MLLVTTWPDVGLAVCAMLPGIVAAVIAYLNRREIRTPSGDSLGRVAERTHDMTAASVALGTRTVKILNGADREEDSERDAG